MGCALRCYEAVMFRQGLGKWVGERRGEERRETETKESVSRMKKGHRIWIPQFQVRVPELSEATALPALMFDITVFLT